MIAQCKARQSKGATTNYVYPDRPMVLSKSSLGYIGKRDLNTSSKLWKNKVTVGLPNLKDTKNKSDIRIKIML